MESAHNGRSLHDLAGFIYSVLLMAFALLGMGGVVYHCIAPAGIFAPSLGRLWSKHPVLALLVSIGLVVVVLAARGQAMALRRIQGSNDMPLYVFVAFGTFFASRLIVSGTL